MGSSCDASSPNQDGSSRSCNAFGPILKRTGCAQLMIATSTPSQYPSKTEAGAEALDNIGEERAGGELPIA